MRLGALVSIPIGLTVAHLTIPGLADAGSWWLNLYNLTFASAVVVMALGLRANRPAPVPAWAAMLTTLVLWLIGDLIYERIGGDPVASVADGFYLAGYGTLAAALVAMLRRRAGPRTVDNLIDVVIALLASATVIWELVVVPMWSDPGAPVVGRLMASAYPVADVVIAVLLLQLLLGPGRRVLSMALVGAGTAVLVVADVGYAVAAQADTYGGSTVVWDTMWLAGYVAFAAAAVHRSAREVVAPVVETPRLAPTHVLMASLALLTIPMLAGVQFLLGRDPDGAVMSTSGILLVVLVGWRFVRLARAFEDARSTLERRDAYHRALAANSSDAVVVLDQDNEVLDASVSVASLLGRSDLADFRAAPLLLVHEDDRAIGAALVDAARRSPGHTVRGEVRTAAPDEEQWVDLRVVDLSADPVVAGLVINIHDATLRKAAERELTHQAFHDSLTGLANRALFRDRVGHALARSGRDLTDVAVVLCDLDDFRTVNDSLGHRAGDELLCTMAERLRGAVRSSDTLARLGGDEFAVLIEGGDDVEGQAEVVAERVLEVIERPLVVGGTELVVSGSAGIACSAQGAGSADDLLRNADLAMYASKHRGRNLFTHYHPQMGSAAVSRLELEADLRTAVHNDELVLHVQPLVELGSRTVIGFEALVRWQHPRKGLVMPGDFIGIAEQSSIILDIGDWVLAEAVRTLASWNTRNGSHPPLVMSVNVSARQLADPHLPARFGEIIARFGVDAHHIVLELTESALVAEPDTAARHLGALKELGFRVAIDDFGTGYSSLSYLRQFPVDVIKVDRSFVETIIEAPPLPGIVRGMLDLGRSLQLESVAEGIEHEHQAQALILAGCTYGQGYHFARPMDTATATEVALTRRLPTEAPVRA